ncbi:MAG: protein translocase component YidC [Acholeplasmatales bacterium]|nr:MAG: protein translocase component YidC [Acholeplasmatales bacterium]
MRNVKKIVLLTAVMLLVLTLSGCNTEHYNMGIGEGGGFGWVQWIVARVADLIYWVSSLAGGHYIVGLVAITLFIRIAGWPIYAKTNALSANMQVAQPALEKLKEKYLGKTDPQSQRMMQQEMMQIYKEYGINPLGCVLPLLQMPIFIAMYQTVRRIPLTDRFTENLNFNFLWFNFAEEPVSPFFENIGQNLTFIIMAAIVGVTMFLYQVYAMRKPAQLQNKKYQSSQQAQTEKTMKYMMYFMTFMLVFIAYTSLGIAVYWVIGNGLQFLQTYISRKQLIAKIEARKLTV